MGNSVLSSERSTTHTPPITHVCKTGPDAEHPDQPKCTEKYHYGGLWFPARVGPDIFHLRPTPERLVRDYLEKRSNGRNKFFNLERVDGMVERFDDNEVTTDYHFWAVEWLDINYDETEEDLKERFAAQGLVSPDGSKRWVGKEV